MTFKFKLLLFCVTLLVHFQGLAQQILEGGKIKEKNFIENIPFSFDYGIPLIKVEISGRVYTFMFDTGAPTMISPQLAKTLNLDSGPQGTIYDSQGNSTVQKFVTVPNLQIGGLHFEDIGAVILDLQKVFEFKCLNFDGIIGANLMQKAIWQIDYQKKHLTATDKLKALELSNDAKVIKFIAKKLQQTPLVPLKIGEKTTYQTFDTGSAGGFVLNSKSYQVQFQSIKKIEALGSMGAGINGTSKGMTISYYKIPSVTIGEDIILTNQVYQAAETTTQTIGNLFLKNYKIVIDWNTQKIYMTKITDYNETKLESFGFSIRYADQKAVINKIYKNSAAENKGLELNDEVVTINGKSFLSIPDAEACSYLIKSPLADLKLINISLRRNGKIIDLELKKETLIN